MGEYGRIIMARFVVNLEQSCRQGGERNCYRTAGKGAWLTSPIWTPLLEPPSYVYMGVTESTDLYVATIWDKAPVDYDDVAAKLAQVVADAPYISNYAYFYALELLVQYDLDPKEVSLFFMGWRRL